jgi:hypothetical protein
MKEFWPDIKRWWLTRVGTSAGVSVIAIAQFLVNPDRTGPVSAVNMLSTRTREIPTPSKK